MDNVYCTKPVKVLKKRKHTLTECSFFLDYKVKEEPGKFIMVSCPGAGEVPISISGFFHGGIEITVRNIGRATSSLFETNEGEYLHVRGPYGNMFPVDRFFGKHLLIIAGGSGIAAVKSVIEYFQRVCTGQCALKKLDILAGFKSPKHILFKQELKAWVAWRKRCDIKVTVDTVETEEEKWLGGIGFVVDFIKHVEDIGENTHAVIVGPPLMMTNSVKELTGCGVKEENIWLSFERHMKCGVGKCGHCRIRDKYVCVDGPIFNYEEAKGLID